MVNVISGKDGFKPLSEGTPAAYMLPSTTGKPQNYNLGVLSMNGGQVTIDGKSYNPGSGQEYIDLLKSLKAGGAKSDGSFTADDAIKTVERLMGDFERGSMTGESWITKKNELAPVNTQTGQASSGQTNFLYGADVLDKKANDASVNALYNAYFNRDASKAELANWGASGGADTTVKALESFLQGERTKYGVKTPLNPLGVKTGAQGDKVTPGATQKETVIGADTMGQDKDITLPNAEPGADVSGEIVGGAEGTMTANEEKIKTLQERVDALTLEKTENQLERDDISDAMSELLGEQANKATDQLAKEQELGIPELRQTYAELNTEIKTKLAQYNALKVEIEGKPITMSSIIGQQAQVEKKKLAEIGILQAQAQGLAGEIETAQATADRAIDLKYSTQETTLKIYQAQLDLLSEEISEENQVRLLAQQQMLDEETARLNERKAVEKSVQALSLQVMANTKDKRLADRVANAGSMVEAMQIAGDFATEEGWTYVETIADRDRLQAQGYELKQLNGRIYARQGGGISGEAQALANQVANGNMKLSSVPADMRAEVAQALGDTTISSGGGGPTTKQIMFKFSSDDIGRLLNVGFTSAEANQIQADINEFGVDATVQGMPANQAKAIRDIAGGVTPTQVRAEEKVNPESISADKRKVIGGINALMSDNASKDEIEEYIKLKGYELKDFTNLGLSTYKPEEKRTFWQKIIPGGK